MQFRTRLVALFAVFVAVALVTSTGAFTTVSAERTVSVDVAGDNAALVQVSPHSGPNGAYAELSSGEFRINFNNVGATGVNPNATTRLENVFNVTNQGTQSVTLTISETGNNPTAVDFETADGTRLDGDSSGVSVVVGGTVEVTIVIDTTGISSGTSLLDSITINASA